MSNPDDPTVGADDCPMFPLGSVLLPYMPLPLHIFEPRYRALVDTCMANDRRFGVTLIERGSEVGGGDLRSLVGTMAKIVEAERFDDGRWGLIAYGQERIRVRQWLDDAPFPRASVEPWPEPDLTEIGRTAMPGVMQRLRRALALKAELGEPATAATADFTDDPAGLVFQACAVAPIGPLDQFELLCAASADARVTRLDELLADQIELLEGRMAMGSD